MTRIFSPPAQRTFDSRLGHVEFCDVGSGLPVLYFHGTGAGNESAVLLERELIASGCRLIAPNRPGYFNTTLGPFGSVEHCAHLAVELLDHLEVERAAVIGTSGGGMPAAAFARLHPARTAALVLQCAQSHRWDHARWMPQGIGGGLFLFRHRVFYPLLRSYNRFSALSLRRNPDMCLRRFSGSRFPLVESDPAIRESIRALTEVAVACAGRPRGIENDWAIFVGENGIRPDTICCPALIIHDSCDPLVPFAHAEWSQASIAGSRLLEVRAGGHLIWFGPDAEKMNRERCEFLRAHVTGGG